MKKTSAKLEALLKQEKELNAQIKKAKAAQRKQEAEIMRQRAQILGFALMSELEQNQDLAAKLEPLIHARITAPTERRLLGLPPLPKNDNTPAVPPKASENAPEETAEKRGFLKRS